jgi:Na+-translocating ferredoxin:NAD+ oxidoreductase subunit D
MTERTELVLSTQPFLHEGGRTPRIMKEVTAAAVVVLIAATWRFGVAAPLVTGAAVAGSVGAEWFFTRHRSTSPLHDWSALLTGLLLGLTLPPTLPLWMAFLGGVAGMGLGKLIWGGLGQNIFNPALVGRAFLQAAFPTAITTWSPPSISNVPRSLFAPPLMHGEVDAISTATPLGLAKFEHEFADLLDLLLGSTAGSLGETNALLLILCGAFLCWRKLCDWRLPVATVVATAVFAQLLNWVMPGTCPTGVFMALSGGILFGAVFMVTDPVTTPTTARGAWIFGIGVGFLVVLIRNFGGLPEGVMYAILLMNAATPHIERYTQPRPFGG